MLLKCLVMGIIQGLTEFLPVSSSGHLALVEMVWPGAGETEAFIPLAVWLHVATFLAVLLYFHRDLIRLLQEKNWRLLGLLGLATVPAAVLGPFLEDRIEAGAHDPRALGIAFAVTALLLWSGEKRGEQRRELSALGWKGALKIGLAQALAMVPGISRSGSTISFGLRQHLTREAAVRFSFLMSLPVIGGSAVLKLKDLHECPLTSAPLMLGFAAAFAVGLLSVHGMLRLVQARGMKVLIGYCFCLALACLLVPPLGGARRH